LKVVIFISLFDYNSSGCVWNETIDNEFEGKQDFSLFLEAYQIVHRWIEWFWESARCSSNKKSQHILLNQ
jgi:hypothetical protein